MMDYPEYYICLDVEPLLEVITEMLKFYRDDDVDLLLTLSGEAY